MDPEIDLVPSDYRRAITLRKWLRSSGLAYAGIVLVVVLTRAALAYGIRNEEQQIETLRLAEAEALTQQARLEALRAERTQLANRLEVLAVLRGGVAARQMFVAIDRALDGHVWFRHWSFRRAGEVVESRAQPVETGYFIVLPRSAQEEPERAWLMKTHMEVRGEARDHSHLAEFVSQLVKQPEIAEVRVLDTRARNPQAERVDFELAVVVRTRS